MTHTDEKLIAERVAEEWPHMMAFYRNHQAALARLADAFNVTAPTIERYLSTARSRAKARAATA